MIEFTAKIEHLPEVMSYLHAEIVGFGVEKKLIRKMELACEEAVTNIIFYAYPHPQPKGNVCISCEKKGNRIEITLKDHGIPFNPIDVEVNPQTDIPIDDRKVGGLGIFLIRKAIDEAIYQREGDANVLKLVFNY